MKREELFRSAPVSKAVISMAVPTVISQLITVIYNMADTFFIGQLNDPSQVAAATVVMPLFMLLTGIANLYGMGGSSVISRLLGKGKKKEASAVSSFCVLSGILTAFLYRIVLFLARKTLLTVLGASDHVYLYAVIYLFWTVTIGSVPTVMNAELAHLVRSEGASFQAGFGVAMGGILNIILGPVFIFGLHMAIRWAAIATMLSNAAACIYFLAILRKKKDQTDITCHLQDIFADREYHKSVLQAGIPGFIMTAMGTFSNAVLNHLIAGYSEEATAGIGIAKKIDLLAYAVSQGMTQGVLPLIAYKYAPGDHARMHKCIRTAFWYSLLLASAMAVVIYIAALPLSAAFIKDAETVHWSQTFLRIICLACPSSAVNFMMITVFQATGASWQPVVLPLLRKGGLDVPLMILFNNVYGLSMIAWATPAADWAVLILGICIFFPYLNKAQKLEKQTA